MKNLIVDGLSGSGKWVIARLSCCFKDVNNLSIDEGLEIIVNSNYIEPKTNFPQIFETYIRQLNYNKFIGRNLNNRKSDFTYSGIYPFVNINKVSKRKEKEYSFETNKNGISIIETHGGFFCGFINYIKDFNNSIFICKIKRNPMDIIPKWFNYVSR